jgi:hypothetical protein
MGIGGMNAHRRTLTAKIAHGENMVKMSVGQQNQAALGIHAVQGILNESQVVTGVNDTGIPRVPLLDNVAIGAQRSHRHTADFVFAHEKPPRCE